LTTAALPARHARSGPLATNARVARSLAKRALRQALRRPQFLAPLVIFPSLMLAANTGGAGRATELPGFPDVNGFLDFELAGAMLQSAMLAGVSGGIALALDFEIGFIDRLFAAPISRYTIIAGRLAATLVMGLGVAIWFMVGGLLFGAQIEGGMFGALIILVLVCLAAGAFAGLASALAIGAGKASVVQGIFPLVFVILFLSTAFFPENLLLEPAATIARLNPLSLIADGIRGPIIGPVELGHIAKALGGIAIVGVVGLGLSAWALRKRERRGG
jgi:ABC-2 type transport system permease protein